MGGTTSYDHSGVVWISQERYGPRIRNGVDSAQFDVNLEANIRKILWSGMFALETLQALSCHPNLVVSSVKGNERKRRRPLT